MIDFPDTVWLGSDEEIGAIFLEEDERYLARYDDTREYIRSDLVPQWQPIETMPDRPGQVFLSTPNGCYNVGTVLDQWVFLWKTKEPVRRDSYSHWMPIPKVPE